MNHIPVESLKKLSSYSSGLPWLHLPFRIKTAKKGWKLISTVICDFFLLQNLHKFKITKHPVIFVDAPLDKKIPFDPSKEILPPPECPIKAVPSILKPKD